MLTGFDFRGREGHLGGFAVAPDTEQSLPRGFAIARSLPNWIESDAAGEGLHPCQV